MRISQIFEKFVLPLLLLRENLKASAETDKKQLKL